MDFQKILSELRSERDRINQAIAALEALEGTSSSAQPARRGRKPAASAANPTRKKRGGLTPAGRKRLSENMKKRWAERRKKTKAA